MHRRTFMTSAATALFMLKTPALATKPHLIDDFSADDGRAQNGNRWMGFTDQVMGGRSEGLARLDEIDGRPCLRLTGQVNTRGGGFIQIALDFGEGRKPFDATQFEGLELDVYGNNEDYNCHIRTTDVRWYEQSYQATFHAPSQWTTIALPWNAFTPYKISAPLNVSRLLRLGILGWMRDFDADIAISRVSLI